MKEISTRHADETKHFFQMASAFVKKNTEGVRYFNAADRGKIFRAEEKRNKVPLRDFFQTASAFVKKNTEGVRYFNAAEQGVF